MISNEQIINDVIKEFSDAATPSMLHSHHKSSTIFLLIRHVLKICNVDENTINEDDVKNVFVKYLSIGVNGMDVSYGMKGWNDSSSPIQRRYDLYQLFYKISIAHEEKEHFPIQEKLTKQVCFILKEVLKPYHLVPVNSHSLFKQRKRKKEESIECLYYVPKPFTKNYGGVPQYHDINKVIERTKQMQENRESMIRREKQKLYQEEQMKKRKLNPPPPTVNKTMDWRTIPKNDEERTQKLQPVVFKRYVPPQRRRY